MRLCFLVSRFLCFLQGVNGEKEVGYPALTTTPFKDLQGNDIWGQGSGEAIKAGKTSSWSLGRHVEVYDPELSGILQTTSYARR